MHRLGSRFECYHFNMINWPGAFYYDNKPSQINGREVNSHRYYFTINLCGTGGTPGSADRQVSALGYVTDCSTRHVGIYCTHTVYREWV